MLDDKQAKTSYEHYSLRVSALEALQKMKKKEKEQQEMKTVTLSNGAIATMNSELMKLYEKKYGKL